MEQKIYRFTLSHTSRYIFTRCVTLSCLWPVYKVVRHVLLYCTLYWVYTIIKEVATFFYPEVVNSRVLQRCCAIFVPSIVYFPHFFMINFSTWVYPATAVFLKKILTIMTEELISGRILGRDVWVYYEKSWFLIKEKWEIWMLTGTRGYVTASLIAFTKFFTSFLVVSNEVIKRASELSSSQT